MQLTCASPYSLNLRTTLLFSLSLSESMKHTLILGFRCFLNVSSFAVIPRNLRVGGFVSVKAIRMGSERLGSCSSALQKSTESVGNGESQAEKRVSKESEVEGRVIETEAIGDDLDSIERMTVQELRSKLRSVGISAKGRKHDLVSALRSFLHGKVDDNVFPITKAERLSGEGHIQNMDTVLEFSEHQQTKRRVMEVEGRDGTTTIKSTSLSTKQQLSIAVNEVSGIEPSRSKRKAPLGVACGDVGVSDLVDLSVDQNEPWTVLAHKKPQKGWIPYNPRTMRPPPLTRDTKFVKIMSWNVNGLRALLKLEGFSALQLAEREEFDVLCLQETKIQEKDVEVIKQSLLDGYENSYWTCSVSKLGYSGTAIVSRIKPLSVKYGLGISDHDSEGRLVTVEFDTHYVLSGYVPNSGDGLKRLSYRITDWDPSLSNYMKELEKSKPVILTGDLNCAHEEIDIHDPAGNKRSAGFTIEERQSFHTNFLSRGFVDTFRKQHPGVLGYTYWGYRHGARKSNKGWRLDYFLVSESIADNVHDSYILPDVTGSDHCPIGLILKL